MRNVLALVSLAGALVAASCDFDFAYQQYCDGNPACADAGPDAGQAGVDASHPDAGSLKPCKFGDQHACPGEVCQEGYCRPIQCNPEATTFSPQFDGPSTCWYGQICSEQGSCKMVDNHCGDMRPPPRDHGPVITDASWSVLHGEPQCDPLLKVTMNFYAPFGLDYDPFFGWDLETHFSSPGIYPDPNETIAVRQETWATLDGSWGSVDAYGCCDNAHGDDFSGWRVQLATSGPNHVPRFGPEMCLAKH
ncbi:MAG: hypothetical protein QM765_18560 [Myxococcales bacterium]